MSTKWTVINNQSTVTFNVAHADESTVEGRFDKFHGDIVAEDDKFNRADFTFAIEVKSINTQNQERDEVLKSKDFFDVANFPQISFISERTGIDEGTLFGKLEIKGVKKDTTLTAELENIDDNTKILHLNCLVNRKEFGLIWEGTHEDESNVISEIVLFEAHLLCVKNSD